MDQQDYGAARAELLNDMVADLAKTQPEEIEIRKARKGRYLQDIATLQQAHGRPVQLPSNIQG